MDDSVGMFEALGEEAATISTLAQLNHLPLPVESPMPASCTTQLEHATLAGIVTFTLTPLKPSGPAVTVVVVVVRVMK